jgi:cellobiose-specific phosphotransferase system component IIA
MFLLVIASAVALGFCTWRSEASIRSAGYVLQLNGMILAIKCLLSIRAHFGQTLLRKLLLNWLKRFPKWKRNVDTAVLAVNLPLVGMKLRGMDWTPDHSDQPIEKRIEGIVKNLEIIRTEQRELANSIDELKQSHEEHKKTVTEQAKRMEDEIRAELEFLHTSDLIASVVGLLLILVGITMSTMAPELYQWLR